MGVYGFTAHYDKEHDAGAEHHVGLRGFFRLGAAEEAQPGSLLSRNSSGLIGFAAETSPVTYLQPLTPPIARKGLFTLCSSYLPTLAHG